MMTEQNLATLQNLWPTDGRLALSARGKHDWRTEEGSPAATACTRSSKRSQWVERTRISRR
jgi:hypothetical protein